MVHRFLLRGGKAVWWNTWISSPVSIKWLDWYVFLLFVIEASLWIFMRNRLQSVQKAFSVFVFMGSGKKQRHLRISLEFLMLCRTFINCGAERNNSSNSSFPTRDCTSFGNSTLLSHKDSMLLRSSENSGSTHSIWSNLNWSSGCQLNFHPRGQRILLWISRT